MDSGPDEIERNSNVSPSKSSDPNRKKTFKIITSVKKGGTGSGDLTTDNDADSVDGLDESQTEDLSSEFYDSSKATELDFDQHDAPLTPDEVTSTTTIVMKQKPDHNSQSRFKVVKIETKEPFRRGKWVCYDFFDTAPAAVVTLNGSKSTEDSIIQSALSGAFTAESNNVNYVPENDVNESSSNLFVAPVMPLSPASVPGQPILSDIFFPIQPAPASQAQSNIDGGLSSVVPQYPQPIHMTVPGGVPGGVPSSSSFHSIAQPGNTVIVQSLPNTNVFPYAQNNAAPFLNGNTGDRIPQSTMQNSGHVVVSGSGQALASFPSEEQTNSSGPGQGTPVLSPGAVAIAQGKGQVHHQISEGGSVGDRQESGSISAPTVVGGAGQVNGGVVMMDGAGVEDRMGPGMDDSMSSVKTLEPGDAQDPAKLEEAVETVCNDTAAEGKEEDPDDENGGSTVAIDNKIEQAMDLVKRHLMYAVREEVEILKQQISEMVERITQLEYENSVLRAEAKPETLARLLLPQAGAITQAQGQTQPQVSVPSSAMMPPQQTVQPNQNTVQAQTQHQQQQPQQVTAPSGGPTSMS